MYKILPPPFPVYKENKWELISVEVNDDWENAVVVLQRVELVEYCGDGFGSIMGPQILTCSIQHIEEINGL